MEDILAITLIFGGMAAFLISISPIGKAIADRIRNGGRAAGGQEVEQLKESQVMLLEEVDALRQDVTELQERLDFAERMLAREREAGRLGPGGAGDDSHGVQA